MKKKLLTILLATTLVVGTFTGCGAQLTLGGGESTTITSEETDEEESTEEDAEESTEEESAEETEEESTEEASEESTEESEETSEESAEESEDVFEESTLEESEEESSEEAEEDQEVFGDNEWASAYDDYFERDDIMSENVMMTINTSADGVEMSVIVAVANEVSYMKYDFGVARLDMYGTEDMIYTYAQMGEEEQWSYVPVTSEEEAAEVMQVEENTAFDQDGIESCVYLKEVEENGVTYDVLDVVMNGEPAEFYINRETQKIEKFTYSADGADAVCYIEEIDSIEIPSEVSGAVEITEEELATQLLAVLFTGMAAAMEN